MQRLKAGALAVVLLWAVGQLASPRWHAPMLGAGMAWAEDGESPDPPEAPDHEPKVETDGPRERDLERPDPEEMGTPVKDRPDDVPVALAPAPGRSGPGSAPDPGKDPSPGEAARPAARPTLASRLIEPRAMSMPARTTLSVADFAFRVPKDAPLAMTDPVPLTLELARWIAYAGLGGLVAIGTLFAAGFWAKRRILRR